MKTLGLATILSVAAWVVLVLYVLHPALAFNPLSLPFEKEVSARMWSPQGWKFFTRNPREDMTLLYRRGADGQWQYVTKGPNFQLSNLFGLSREPRAQGIELGLLLYDAPRNKWRDCEERAVSCLEKAPIAGTLQNRSPNPTLCGTVGVVMQKVVPWAWAQASNEITMPSKIVRWEVQC